MVFNTIFYNSTSNSNNNFNRGIMMDLYITGLVVGVGLGMIITASGLLVYLEYFNKSGE